MKKKIMAMVFAAMMMVGSMTPINGGTGVPCTHYSFWCGDYGDVDAGGGMGIACGSNLEQALQFLLHYKEACHVATIVR